MRGTKRACQECGVRFYDLLREPILCPSCGARHAAEAPPVVVEGGARAARFRDNAGWRGRSFRRPDAEPDAAPEIAAAEDAAEEAPGSNDDVVLVEEEPDEADISGLLGDREAEPREP